MARFSSECNIRNRTKACNCNPELKSKTSGLSKWWIFYICLNISPQAFLFWTCSVLTPVSPRWLELLKWRRTPFGPEVALPQSTSCQSKWTHVKSGAALQCVLITHSVDHLKHKIRNKRIYVHGFGNGLVITPVTARFKKRFSFADFSAWLGLMLQRNLIFKFLPNPKARTQERASYEYYYRWHFSHLIVCVCMHLYTPACLWTVFAEVHVLTFT